MMRHAKGKSFIANERLFRGEKAGWFPNVWGDTLMKSGEKVEQTKEKGWAKKLGWNTTQVLQGKVNIVAVFSGVWAENQTKTFVDKNRELMDMLGGKWEHEDLVQLTKINYEDFWLRRMMIFKGKLRKETPREAWGRYFIANKSLRPDEIREAMGFLNSRVGYVYLVDRHCRIRWAGSGNAESGELESLNTGVRKLLLEVKKEIEAEEKSPFKTRPEDVNHLAIAS